MLDFGVQIGVQVDVLIITLKSTLAKTKFLGLIFKIIFEDRHNIYNGIITI